MAPGTPSRSNFEEFNIEDLLRDDRDYFYRSGSAPPTVDGSHAAAAGMFRPHAPAYAPYYYNERMPPPSPSREDWRGAQSGSSLFSVQPGIPEREPVELWRLRGTDPGLGGPPMRADRVQGDFGQPTYISGHQQPSSRNAFDNIIDPLRLSDLQLTQLHNDMSTLESMHSGATSNGLVRVRSLSSTMSDSFASTLGTSGVRSTSPDPRLIRRAPSPCLQAMGGGRVSDTEKKIFSNGFDGVSSGKADWDDVSARFSGLKLSDKITEDSQNHLQGQLQPNYSNHPELLFNMPNDQRQSVARSSCNYRTYGSDIDFIGCDPNAYSVNQETPLLLNNRLDTGANLAVAAEGQYLNRIRNQVGSTFQVPVTDPSYAQYLQRVANYGAPPPSILGTSLARNYQDARLMDLPGYQEAYLGALLAQQKLLNDSRLLGKAGDFDNGLYGNPAFGLDVPYPNQLSGSLSPFGSGSCLRPTDRMLLRGASGVSKGSWNHENGITEESMASTLLEELKNNKTRSFELSEIVGHVVEFSGDQYGSRFIQQKLETASVEEKNSIFPEILPNARVLMTDVFGNYVIQKFFEYGTENQRNQLTDALMGFVLPLSLQMYGCRVIQKALEVANVDQQTRMVTELDGSVMKCVRDQNGNHVIQKCIECVPQEKIQFIISSFYGQVIPLSTHPYGCRVIQRVLEHCDDEQTQSRMMEEILKSVCTLAQDQYGNYVIQHVLQHGKPEERASIIDKLTGQIVKMSQQKYASNVVEKCLAYSTPEEREILIEEMLGTTEDNEPLQAMMKDQFGNYVVQKVLEYCDDQKLQLIISRIKVHLTVLKKYTYGKHIVARVEKLIATGERRIGMSANSA